MAQVVSGNRKSYNFKSVGQTVQEFNKENEIDLTSQPIGLKTPLEFGKDNSGLFQMHHSTLGQIKDNFRNMIMTNHGERLGFPKFGGNLEELLFELSAMDADNEAIKRITTSTNKFMPFISLKTFEALKEPTADKGVYRVRIRVIYTVPSISQDDQAVDVMMYYVG